MNRDILHTRLDIWREKLVTIERALDEELRKDYSSRRRNLMLFLYREKAVCVSVISELSALAKEAGAKSNV
jgi:hypothetical protein